MWFCCLCFSCNGFEGAPFSMFLERLLFDISDFKGKFIMDPSQLFILSNFLVPFLSPPNLQFDFSADCLTYLRNNNVLIGNMERTRNETNVDFKCTVNGIDDLW